MSCIVLTRQAANNSGSFRSGAGSIRVQVRKAELTVPSAFVSTATIILGGLVSDIFRRRGLLIGGLALMLAMHGYSLRKRLPLMSRLGSLTTWLEFHIFCGFFGPVLITLHTSFKIDGLVAVSYWSMAAVAMSPGATNAAYGMSPTSPTREPSPKPMPSR